MLSDPHTQKVILSALATLPLVATTFMAARRKRSAMQDLERASGTPTHGISGLMPTHINQRTVSSFCQRSFGRTDRPRTDRQRTDRQRADRLNPKSNPRGSGSTGTSIMDREKWVREVSEREGWLPEVKVIPNLVDPRIVNGVQIPPGRPGDKPPVKEPKKRFFSFYKDN